MIDVRQISCFSCFMLINGVVASVCKIEEHALSLIQISSSPGTQESTTENETADTLRVVKFTQAAERNPLHALKFLDRYLKMEPREDTPWGNSMFCDGDLAYASRSDLIPEGSGICTIITSGVGNVVVASEPSNVAISLGESILWDCVFDENRTISLSTDSITYDVHTSTQRQCCLACQADEDCLASNYAPGSLNETILGFGVHLPATTSRVVGMAGPVRDIERMVESKANNMTEFDAWMDFNIGLYTSDIDSYVEVFEAESIPYLPSKWPLGKWPQATTMYSLFVNVPTTQLFVEIMGLNSSLLEEREGVMVLEQRMPELKILQMYAENRSKDVLVEMRISRAASNLERIEDFYGGGMQLSTSLSVDEINVSVRCYEWSPKAALVCFTKRPNSTTKGSFKVGDFEDMLYKNAQRLTENPLCNSNRWFDNHYSVTKKDDDSIDVSVHDYIVDFVDANPQIPHVCHPDSGLYYLVDPTGWAVQFPSGIGSRLPFSCGGGNITPMIYENTTAEFVFCELGVCDGVDFGDYDPFDPANHPDIGDLESYVKLPGRGPSRKAG